MAYGVLGSKMCRHCSRFNPGPRVCRWCGGAEPYKKERPVREAPRRDWTADDFHDSGAPQSEWAWNAQHADPDWP